MPLDRSPPRTETTNSTLPSTSTALTSSKENILNQVGSEIFNSPSGNMQQQSGESIQIHSNEFRLVKLPTFWHKQPKLWFAQVESEFLVFRIRSEEIKYSTVIRHLDEKALIVVSEIVENPPENDKYNALKSALINRFTDSEEKRLRQLLAGIELNDKKPTELLREIRQLSGGSLADNILHSLWLQRLPYKVQATLAVVEDVPLIKLAELADKIVERDTGYQITEVNTSLKSKQSDLADLEKRIAALEVFRRRGRSFSRSRSKTRLRSNSKDKKSDSKEQICFYHKKFGDKAKKCTIPCTKSKTLCLTDSTEN
ncbi:uncharacterized protein LOC114938562 [Nylanderia fulva]|uniref:uncharacterized protein LOC114938562 n=1 Tax=Nylanderia fulva TaxID=613905 RepID=UPI0010FB672A|nr:uncharacterized protein LOC114938562 [Nylanderia fulva]